MVARTDQQRCVPPNPVEIFFDDDDLNVKIQNLTEVQQIAADNDQVKTAGVRDQPVKLFKRVVQVGNEQHPHRSLPQA